MTLPEAARSPLARATVDAETHVLGTPGMVLRDAVMDVRPAVPGRRSQAEASPLLGPTLRQGIAPRPSKLAAPPAMAPVLHAQPHAAAGVASLSGSEEGPGASSPSDFDRGMSEGLARAQAEKDRWSQDVMARAKQELDARTERMRKELTSEAQQAYQAKIQLLDRMLGSLPEQIAQRIDAAEDDMLSLCFATVCRVLGQAFIEPSFVQRHLRQAIADHQSGPLTAVHLHPQDLAKLRQDPEALPTALTRPELQWVETPGMTSGGCLLQSPDGALDARLETQMKAFAELLIESRSAA